MPVVASVLWQVRQTRTRVDAFGLFTGQVGYSWNNALLYVKGGAAVTGDRYDGRVTGTNIVFDTARETRWGGVVGVGGEYGFHPELVVRSRIRPSVHGQPRRHVHPVRPVAVISRTDRIRQDVDMVTARINYRWGGPVVAKY